MATPLAGRLHFLAAVPAEAAAAPAAPRPRPPDAGALQNHPAMRSHFPEEPPHPARIASVVQSAKCDENAPPPRTAQLPFRYPAYNPQGDSALPGLPSLPPPGRGVYFSSPREGEGATW